jgi:hypothetical protein
VWIPELLLTAWSSAGESPSLMVAGEVLLQVLQEVKVAWAECFRAVKYISRLRVNLNGTQLITIKCIKCITITGTADLNEASI